MLDWTVIIVNWNTREQLRQCLRSVFASEGIVSFEVSVVDNASIDGSAEKIRREFPKAHLIANKENIGFAKANNQAIRRSSGANILLLNPDCVLSSGALENMLAFIKTHPKAGVVGGRLTGENGELQKSVRNFPTFSSQAAMLLKLHHLYPPIIKKYLAENMNYDNHASVDQIMGAFFAIPRGVLAQVGLLDERFFLWFEEVDYCKRVKAAGYEVYYTPMADVTHIGGESFGQLMPARKQKIWNKSLSSYIKKHHGLLPWLGLQPLRPISLALSWIYGRFGKLYSKHE